MCDSLMTSASWIPSSDVDDDVSRDLVFDLDDVRVSIHRLPFPLPNLRLENRPHLRQAAVKQCSENQKNV